MMYRILPTHQPFLRQLPLYANILHANFILLKCQQRIIKKNEKKGKKTKYSVTIRNYKVFKSQIGFLSTFILVNTFGRKF